MTSRAPFLGLVTVLGLAAGAELTACGRKKTSPANPGTPAATPPAEPTPVLEGRHLRVRADALVLALKEGDAGGWKVLDPAACTLEKACDHRLDAVGGKFSLVGVCRKAGNVVEVTTFLDVVSEGTRREAVINCQRVNHTVSFSLQGNVTGTSAPFCRAYLGLGSPSTVPCGEPSKLKRPRGNLPLVAVTGVSPSAADRGSPQKVLLKRQVEVTGETDLGGFSFSEGLVPQAGQVNVTHVLPGDELSVASSFIIPQISPAMTLPALLHAFDVPVVGDTSAQPYWGVPVPDLDTPEFNHVQVSARAPSQDVMGLRYVRQLSRQVDHYHREVGNVRMELPPAGPSSHLLTRPQADGTSRFVVRWDDPPAALDAKGYRVTLQQEDRKVSQIHIVTEAWLAGTREFRGPDLEVIPGWESAWSLGAGLETDVTFVAESQSRGWGFEPPAGSHVKSVGVAESFSSQPLVASKALIAMQETVCALRSTDDALQCWGASSYDEGRSPPGAFKALAGTPSSNQITSRPHACAIRADDTLHCWGDETTLGRPLAVPADWGTVKSVGVGEKVTCVVTGSGELKCLAVGAAGASGVPTSVAYSPDLGGETPKAAVGDRCALTASDTLRCWTSDAAAAPSQVMLGGAAVKSVQGRCAIKSVDGSVECWGPSGTLVSSVPTNLKALSAAQGNDELGCAVNLEGHVQCWGARALTPPPDLKATAIAVGNDYACALSREGNNVCFGAIR